MWLEQHWSFHGSATNSSITMTVLCSLAQSLAKLKYKWEIKRKKRGQTVVMTAPGGIEIQTNNGARHERKVQSCRLVIKLLIEQFE